MMIPLLILCMVQTTFGFTIEKSSWPVPPVVKDLDAVSSIINRVLPSGSLEHFDLKIISGNCSATVAPPCFSISTTTTGQTKISGSSVSEVAAGIGVYLREYCNMTIGWPRGGGMNVFKPEVSIKTQQFLSLFLNLLLRTASISGLAGSINARCKAASGPMVLFFQRLYS